MKVHLFVPDSATANNIKSEFAGAKAADGSFKGSQGAFVSIPLAPDSKGFNPLVNRIAAQFSLTNKGPAFPPDVSTVKGIELVKGDSVYSLEKSSSGPSHTF